MSSMTENTNHTVLIDPFIPFNFNQLTLRNRFMRSATYDGSADDTGAATEASVGLFRKLGQANISLVVTGHAFIDRSGQAGPGQYGIHCDEMIPGLSRITKAVHEGGGKAAIQISHAGINSGYLQAQGLTALAVSTSAEAKQPHREMAEEDIEKLIDCFVAAARRAVEAGFDAVQLHAAHGYLMSQFLSPITNRRHDKWGGDPEKRRRFHLEVIQRIHKAMGNRIILMAKFGVKDDVEGGLTLEEGLETARRMASAGVSAIEVSGGLGLASVVKGVGYFRDRTAAVKRAVSVPVVVVGGIRNLDIVHSILDNGDADLISMSRPFIRETDLLQRWQKGNISPATCISCSRCLVTTRKGSLLQCAQDFRPKKTTT